MVPVNSQSNLFGITIDSSGSVYQTGTTSDKVYKFNIDGSFISAWGSAGLQQTQLSRPAGIAP